MMLMFTEPEVLVSAWLEVKWGLCFSLHSLHAKKVITLEAQASTISVFMICWPLQSWHQLCDQLVILKIWDEKCFLNSERKHVLGTDLIKMYSYFPSAIDQCVFTSLGDLKISRNEDDWQGWVLASLVCQSKYNPW